MTSFVSSTRTQCAPLVRATYACLRVCCLFLDTFLDVEWGASNGERTFIHEFDRSCWRVESSDLSRSNSALAVLLLRQPKGSCSPLTKIVLNGKREEGGRREDGEKERERERERHIYIYIYMADSFCGPGFSLKVHFCWGFKAKISQQNSHFLCQFFAEISFVCFFRFLLFSLCVPLFSLSLSPSLQKKPGSQKGKSPYIYIYIYASGVLSGPDFAFYELISGPGRVNKRSGSSETACFIVRNGVTVFRGKSATTGKTRNRPFCKMALFEASCAFFWPPFPEVLFR